MDPEERALRQQLAFANPYGDFSDDDEEEDDDYDVDNSDSDSEEEEEDSDEEPAQPSVIIEDVTENGHLQVHCLSASVEVYQHVFLALCGSHAAVFIFRMLLPTSLPHACSDDAVLCCP